MEDRAAWLWAALALEGMGPARIAILGEVFGSVSGAVAVALAGGDAPAGVPSDVFARLKTLDLDGAAQELGAIRSAGIDVIERGDVRYPEPLRGGVRAPPPLLFVQGTLPGTFTRPAHAVRSAAVVGTRRPTGRGRSMAHRLAASLASLDVVVVSGLALGIDGAAHEGALAADGRTVAVLGGGHGHLHPPSHRGLAGRLLAAGGALISEYPPDARPDRHSFPRRNRLVSGLSRIVVVVEAGARSGTFSTVDHALDQHRDVFACPGRPDDPSVAGTLRFLRDGALIVSELEDVLVRFRDESPPRTLRGRDDPVLSALRDGDATLDDLARRAGGPIAGLLARLTELELLGAVERTSDGRYRIGAVDRGRRRGRDEPA